ncbi:MAG: class I SAM-dependent methyltransferase [Nannocystaceae bacterium]
MPRVSRTTASEPCSAQQSERIGPTAHYTAYVWHRLGLPYARHLSTRRGAALYWGFFALGEWTTRLLPAVPSMREYLEYRHRLIDAVVEQLGPGCVVELGAGLTPRAVRWAVDRGVPGIELDLPGMARAKRQRLERMPASARARLRSLHAVHDADVLDPGFATMLADIIGDRPRPVVVAEGLLSYFDPAPRQRVLDAVAYALRRVGGGALVCDLHTARAQAEVGMAAHALRGAIRGLTRRRRALDPFVDLDAMARAFAEAGFDGWDEARPQAHVRAQPRLARLRSPAHVVVGRVGLMGQGTLS